MFADNEHVAYFRFIDDHHDTFVIKLTESHKIQHARKILSGEEKHKVHVNGTIVKATAPYNAPWHYYLDPTSVGFFEISAEVCDSAIRYIENNLGNIGGDTLPNNYWCPWASRLIEEIEFQEYAQTTPFIENVAKFTVNQSSEVASCSFSPDGKRAITGGVDGIVRTWDLSTGQQLKAKKMHKGKVTAILALNQTNSIITAGEDSKLYKWNADTLNIETKYAGHPNPILGVCCTADDSTLFSYGYDKIKVWELNTGKYLNDILFGTNSFAVTPDGKSAVSATTHGNEIKTWLLDVVSQSAQKWATRGNGVPVYHIDIHPHQKKFPLVAYSGIGKMHGGKLGFTVWNHEAGKFKQGDLTTSVNAISFSPANENYLLTADSNHTLQLWDASTLTPLAALKCDAPVVLAKFSKEGNILSYTIDGVLSYSTVKEVITLSNVSIHSKTPASNLKVFSANPLGGALYKGSNPNHPSKQKNDGESATKKTKVGNLSK